MKLKESSHSHNKMDNIRLVKNLIRNLQIIVGGHIECLPFDIIISISLLAAGVSSVGECLSFMQYLQVRQFIIGLASHHCYDYFNTHYLPNNIKLSDISLLCKYKMDMTRTIKKAVHDFKMNSHKRLVCISRHEIVADTYKYWTTSTGNIIVKHCDTILSPGIMSILRHDHIIIDVHIIESFTKVQHSVEESVNLKSIGVIINNKYVPVVAIKERPMESIRVNISRCKRLKEISENVSFYWLTEE